jgi:hypothetical protein
MQNFVREQNIRLFRRLLAETTDPVERAEIQRLLAEEEAKPVDPAKPHAAGPNGGSGE